MESEQRGILQNCHSLGGQRRENRLQIRQVKHQLMYVTSDRPLDMGDAKRRRPISGHAAMLGIRASNRAPKSGDLCESGRSERIRTSDPLYPKQVRYQAAPRSDWGFFSHKPAD